MGCWGVADKHRVVHALILPVKLCLRNPTHLQFNCCCCFCFPAAVNHPFHLHGHCKLIGGGGGGGEEEMGVGEGVCDLGEGERLLGGEEGGLGEGRVKRF